MNANTNIKTPTNFRSIHSDRIFFKKPYDYDLDTKFFIANLIKYAVTPPNQLQRCILNDYFNNYNFSKLK